MKKTLVYIAGPYRADTISSVRRNIEAARAVAEQLWARGYPCLCPHLNTAYMSGIIDEEIFLAGARLMLRWCDNVVLVGDWIGSVGTRRELAQALEQGQAIYASPAHLFEGIPMTLDTLEHAIGWAPKSV